MSAIRKAAFIVGILAVVLVSGCGGGGGGTTPGNNQPPPVQDSNRYITGTVVGSANKTGVGNVIVRLGSGSAYSATTASDGTFTITISAGVTSLPDHIEIDTGNAGSVFPPTGLVTYNGQTYFPDFVDMPVGILNDVTDNLGTITVTETSDTVPGSPYPSKDTVILGRVVAQSTGEGISGVQVTFGYAPTRVATTGKNGYFALNLGRDATVMPLFPADTWVQIDGNLTPTFSINTNGATGFPSTLDVSFNGVTSEQSTIILPNEVLTAGSTTLGTITVLGSSSGGGTVVAQGRIIDQNTGKGPATTWYVTFGTVSPVTASTDANGYFALRLSPPASVEDLYGASDQRLFTVADSQAGTPPQYDIYYGGVKYGYLFLPVPAAVLNGSTIEMGTITVVSIWSSP